MKKSELKQIIIREILEIFDIEEFHKRKDYRKELSSILGKKLHNKKIESWLTNYDRNLEIFHFLNRDKYGESVVVSSSLINQKQQLPKDKTFYGQLFILLKAKNRLGMLCRFILLGK